MDFKYLKKKSRNKPAIKAFCAWLQQKASLCIDSLGVKITDAREPVANSILFLTTCIKIVKLQGYDRILIKIALKKTNA